MKLRRRMKTPVSTWTTPRKVNHRPHAVRSPNNSSSAAKYLSLTIAAMPSMRLNAPTTRNRTAENVTIPLRGVCRDRAGEVAMELPSAGSGRGQVVAVGGGLQDAGLLRGQLLLAEDAGRAQLGDALKLVDPVVGGRGGPRHCGRAG